MPQQTFEVTAPNGQTLEITGDRMPNEGELRSIFAAKGVDVRGATPQGSAVSRFASGVGEMINPVSMVKGAAQAVMHPIDTAKAIYAQQGGEFDKAVQAAKEGRYSEMAGHGAASLLPVVGPLAANIGEQAASGDYAGAAGRTIGMLAGGKMLEAGTKLLPAGVKMGVNPATREAELARFGLENGVPVDAASATANPLPRAVQKIVTNNSIAGSVIGTNAAAARTEGLATLGEQLASKGYAGSATKETAGAAARSGVEDSIRGFDDVANANYGKLREMEAASEVPKAIETQSIHAPVDLESVKPALQPVLDKLLRKKEITGSLQGSEARAATALDALVNGKSAASLSDVDAALSDIKSLARGASMPELRNAGQGAAALAVQKLDQAVMQSAKNLGPEAVDALKAGRMATVQKYAASEVLDSLNREPVRSTNAAVAPQDAAVMHLRDLQRYAPEALPQVGKAVLSDMLGEATKNGSFESAASLASKWEKLGPETKKLLFPDSGHVADLDKFWALAKKMGENPNPSGSGTLVSVLAQGAMLTNPLTLAGYQIAGGTLAKLLSSPTVTKALVDASTIPLRAKGAALARYGRLTNLIDQATTGAASPAAAPAGSK